MTLHRSGGGPPCPIPRSSTDSLTSQRSQCCCRFADAHSWVQACTRLEILQRQPFRGTVSSRRTYARRHHADKVLATLIVTSWTKVAICSCFPPYKCAAFLAQMPLGTPWTRGMLLTAYECYCGSCLPDTHILIRCLLYCQHLENDFRHRSTRCVDIPTRCQIAVKSLPNGNIVNSLSRTLHRIIPFPA